jgi:hypothetical protein
MLLPASVDASIGPKVGELKHRGVSVRAIVRRALLDKRIVRPKGADFNGGFCA